MRVLLGLGGAELRQPVLGDHLGEDLPGLLRREGHRQVERLVVLGHADVTCRAAARPGRTRGSPGTARARVSSRARSARKLKKMTASPSRMVATGVSSPSTITVGRNELVGHLLGVRRAHRLQRTRGAAPGAAHHRVVRLLDPVPALVAVHRVEAAADRGDAAGAGLPQEALQLLQVARAPLIGGVSRPSRKACT